MKTTTIILYVLGLITGQLLVPFVAPYIEPYVFRFFDYVADLLKGRR